MAIGLVAAGFAPQANATIMPGSALSTPWMEHARDVGIINFTYTGPFGQWVISAGDLAEWESVNGCRTCAYSVFGTVVRRDAGFSIDPLLGLRYLKLTPELLESIRKAQEEKNAKDKQTDDPLIKALTETDAKKETPSSSGEFFSGSNSLVANNFSVGSAFFTSVSGPNAFTVITLAAVPEPLTLSLFGAGLIGLFGVRRRTRA
jgi:hypothetical protein